MTPMASCATTIRRTDVETAGDDHRTLRHIDLPMVSRRLAKGNRAVGLDDGVGRRFADAPQIVLQWSRHGSPASAAAGRSG